MVKIKFWACNGKAELAIGVVLGGWVRVMVGLFVVDENMWFGV
jgi:hypothetical protein